MHFNRLIRAQKGLLNAVAKVSNLHCCYEIVGSTTIQ